MSDKKKTTGAKVEPEEEIRCGDVIASIYRRQSNAGYSYRDFTLTRCWTSLASGKESRGSSYYPENVRDLVAAIKAASDHIKAKNGGHADHVAEDPTIDDSME